MKGCSVAGCVAPHVARGLCSKHYQRARSAGLPNKRIPSAEERFWQKVDKTPGCWLWTACVTGLGYGQFRVTHGAPTVYAHRWAYEAMVGPIPDELVLDHLCRTPSCVNPSHLEPVTQRINVLRGESPVAKRARQTHRAVDGVQP